MKRLAIVTTHPIQYNAPLFQLLARRNQIEIKVFYTWGQSKEQVYDAKFGIKREWDIPLLDGYAYEFIENISKHPDSNRFWGIINPNLLKKIKAFEPDAVLVYRWSVFSHFKIMQQLGGSIKLFFRGDSHLKDKQQGVKTFFKSRALKFVFRKVDKAFYVGDYNKQYYLKAGLRNEQLTAAPHAVDNDRFIADGTQWEIKAANERANLNIPADAVVFLYAGKFYELKQLHFLINVFKQITNSTFRLLLVGNGVQESILKNLAKDDERILFSGFKNQTEMPWVYRMGNVFVLPSKNETWGLSINESMACSRAAIVSDGCGCAPELIVKGKTGFVFEVGNEFDLIACFQQFENVQTATTMGVHALKHIEQFSMEKLATVIEREVLI
jgi:glycosyltransferase involved in cell wall biosynthesis